MSYYPDDHYIPSPRVTYTVDPRYGQSLPRTQMYSTSYSSRPSPISNASLTSHAPQKYLWREDRVYGRTNYPKNMSSASYQSLPLSMYRTQQPPTGYLISSSRVNSPQAHKTASKVGLTSKSRSQYDLSKLTLDSGSYRVAYDDDDDDYDERRNYRTSNDDYGRRQRNGVLISGPCAGLLNLGNTCFMNSILQCLANTCPLIRYFQQRGHQKDVSSERCYLVAAFADVMHTLWNSLHAVAPDNFRYEIGLCAKSFAGFAQHDAQEFLIFLLQRLSEDLNRAQKTNSGTSNSPDTDELSDPVKAQKLWENYLKHENSIITDLFMGQLRSQLKCGECGFTSNTYDPCLGLSLPIKKNYGFQETTLNECFELYSQEEKLDGQEKTMCDKCKKKQKSNKQLSIQRFPKILIIHLKRFSNSRFGHSKLSTKVKVPMVLELSRYSSSDQGSVVYDLYAVCNHWGSASKGHYTSTAKSWRTGQWYHYDDERVAFIPESRPVSSEDAYILFYELSSALPSVL